MNFYNGDSEKQIPIAPGPIDSCRGRARIRYNSKSTRATYPKIYYLKIYRGVTPKTKIARVI